MGCFCPVDLWNFIKCHQYCVNDFPVERHEIIAKMIVRKLYIEPMSSIFCMYAASFIYVMKSHCAHWNFFVNAVTAQHVFKYLFKFTKIR